MISEIANTLLLTYVASEYVVATYNDGNDFVFSGQQNNYTNVFLPSPSKNHKKKMTMTKSTSLIVIIVVVILVNILDHHIVGMSSLVGQGLDVLENYSYVVRFVLAATSYIITLFVDINRRYFFGGVQYVGGGDSSGGGRGGVGAGSTSSSSDVDHNDDEGDDVTRQQERTSGKTSSRRKRKLRRRHYHRLVLPCHAFLPRVGRSFVRVLPAYPFLAVLISFVFMFVISIWEFFNLPERWLQWPIYYGTLYGPFVYVYCTVKRQILCTDGYTLPS